MSRDASLYVDDMIEACEHVLVPGRGACGHLKGPRRRRVRVPLYPELYPPCWNQDRASCRVARLASGRRSALLRGGRRRAADEGTHDGGRIRRGLTTSRRQPKAAVRVRPGEAAVRLPAHAVLRRGARRETVLRHPHTRAAALASGDPRLARPELGPGTAGQGPGPPADDPPERAARHPVPAPHESVNVAPARRCSRHSFGSVFTCCLPATLPGLAVCDGVRTRLRRGTGGRARQATQGEPIDMCHVTHYSHSP